MSGFVGFLKMVVAQHRTRRMGPRSDSRDRNQALNGNLERQERDGMDYWERNAMDK